MKESSTVQRRCQRGSTLIPSREREWVFPCRIDKVELFQFVTPEDSSAAFDELVQHAEAILQRLELHYRVVALCTATCHLQPRRLLTWRCG